jgi:drug/metabolite transporter (DMT)-like permease
MPHARLQWKTRLFAVIVIFSNTLGNFFLARGMKHLDVPVNSPVRMIQAIFTPWVALGICLLILWLLSRMALLSWADLSYVLPVTSLGYVANALMGHYFLGEHITLTRWEGTLLIVAGTVLVGMSGQHAAPQPASERPGEEK